MSDFGETERWLRGLFAHAGSFDYDGTTYSVLKCAKPAPSAGECKTDVYVLAEDNYGRQKEFKISVKQSNADFLENKIKLERAIEIFGDDAQTIIERSIAMIKVDFEQDYLIYFKRYRKTESMCMKMGWKFEFINKSGGERCGQIELTDQQKIDIYAGTNLNEDKRNCWVENTRIENSGVANYILTVDEANRPLAYYLSQLVPIETFAKQQQIYFACKALNYRVNKAKWDGDRPLSVYVDWHMNEQGKLCGDLVFTKPLSVKGNMIGMNIVSLLRSLQIDRTNFHALRQHLHVSVKCHE